MCRSKSKTDATEPTATKRTRSSRSSRPSKRSSTLDIPTPPISSTSSAAPSTSRSNTSSVNYTTSSSNRDNSRASISSKTSLSSIRESLPENPHIYNFSEICTATNNFLAKRFPSSSAAWRCSLHSKDVIIFQRRLRRSLEPSKLRERLSLICRSHHASLINLLGASISGDHIYLVYDFVNGANLADCLRNPKIPNFTVLSNWMLRMQVAMGIANGLDYIHNSLGLNKNFVHNHIKSTSVIITDQPSFHARICSFGTAELCGEIPEYHHQKQHQEGNKEITEITEASSSSSSSKVKRTNSKDMRFEGTRGYMSPEFQATGIGTQKSDVYAFGVVLLELLSGEEPLRYKLDKETGSYRRVSVIETAREAMAQESSGPGTGKEAGGGGGGRLRTWMDRRLKDSFPLDVAEKITRVALDCVDEEPEKRPDMRDVVGKISKLYMKSEQWSNRMGVPTDFTVSFAPR
ncbi:lysM domain receptor-like kinase 3 [Telopea speciosissima]|uniref:lysM domain receptor-like kinase 3 n=1 Tax=Telopea speciosissima TaxID=54955 RepID=UPI001CC4A608|nr:lysM domain receptor-like kinase 3 [Telopea speciosissima]